MNRLTLLFGTIIVTLTSRICEGWLPSGNYAVVLTPMHDNLKLNLDVIPEYAKFLADHNIPGVYVCGSAGEGTNLNLYEKKALLHAWVAAARPYNLKVLAQIGSTAFLDVLELARFCESIGVFAISCLPELYFKAKTAEEAAHYMKMVSDAAPSLPIMYHDANRYTSPKFDMAQLYKVASKTIPQFKGMKTVIGTALKIRAVYKPRSDQQIIISNAPAIRAAYELGFNATIVRPTTLFPDIVNEIQRAVANNEIEAAERAQEFINDMETTGSYTVPFEPGKAAIEMITGIKMGPFRPPVYGPTTYEQRRLLSKLLEQKGVPLVNPVY